MTTLLNRLLGRPLHHTVARAQAAQAAARLFALPEGTVLLGYWQQAVLARASGPEASEAALRFHDGQRAAFLFLLSLIAEGRTGQSGPAHATPPSPTPKEYP